MKKHYYNSLSQFYDDVKNVIGSYRFDEEKTRDLSTFRGLTLSNILKSKFSYQFGVDKLRNFKDFEVQKDIKVRFWDQLDGYDIDIDRMYSDLDFLRNERKVRKLPKTMDVFINISENVNISYDQMLHKTYAALKVVDRLESLGVRTALYACISVTPKVGKRYEELLYIEICVKQHADDVNLGALCTAISPWFFRYWFFLWIQGRYRNLAPVIGHAERIPSSERQKGITIDKSDCLSHDSAQYFIENVRITDITDAA